MTAYNYTYDNKLPALELRQSGGNMLSDQLNRTGSIKYDHRNLMTEIRVIKSEAPSIFEPPVDVLYLTQYRYDEAGNRVRKIRYKYTGSSPDPEFDLSGDAPPWTLQSDEFYVRDVSGKEIALYSGSSLTQWNIWGLDNVGKINADTTRNYYLKDHLGSNRVVLNSTNTVISAQDYDAWGYPLENRTYNASAMKYDFTGKERDDETSYDYFGARYYDSRIANWTSVDILFEKHYDYTPYNYAKRNPVIFIDPDGKQIRFSNDETLRNNELETLRYTQSPEYSEYINYTKDANGNYILDVALLEKGIKENNPIEFNRLLDVAKHKGFIDIKAWLNDPIYYEDGSFNLNTNFTGKDGKEYKRMGYTLVSGNIENPSIQQDKSISGNTEIYYVWLMNGSSRSSILSHELYVHAWNYINGIAYTHDDEGIDDEATTFELIGKQNYENNISK